jgi:hypothetical protein
MASDLAKLLEWVKANDGPNRTLDLAIAQALGQPWACMDNPPAEPGGEWWPSRIRCERYTASLDAALALVERVLPGRSRFVLARATTDVWRDTAPALVPRLALAVLTALLSELTSHAAVGSASLSGETK